MNDILLSALTGAILMGCITWSSKKFSPEVASIITALPIGIVSMYFFNSKKDKQFGYDATLTNITVIIAYISFDFLLKKYKPHVALTVSLIIWALSGTILHLLHVLR
tara:strand:+ start:446 stop:766 length:321 start_codon:yes stop_codon:yes gene_type:complete